MMNCFPVPWAALNTSCSALLAEAWYPDAPKVAEYHGRRFPESLFSKAGESRLFPATTSLSEKQRKVFRHGATFSSSIMDQNGAMSQFGRAGTKRLGFDGTTTITKSSEWKGGRVRMDFNLRASSPVH